MLQIQQYMRATSLEEAYAKLMQNKKNQIIGGMMWLKMEDRVIPTGIDLCDLGLDNIEETEDGFLIGAMTSLRQLECHESLCQWTSNVLKDSVKDIVGVQFRNMATLGGSVYSRFGFSDILTALLCLDCDVHLYHGGVVSIKDYVKQGYERDIITHLFIRKRHMSAAFACVRKSATDLSVLNASASKGEYGYLVCIGARPKRAQCVKLDAGMCLEEMCQRVVASITCEGNMRASKAYREKLVYALCQKVLMKVEGDAYAD